MKSFNPESCYYFYILVFHILDILYSYHIIISFLYLRDHNNIVRKSKEERKREKKSIQNLQIFVLFATKVVSETRIGNTNIIIELLVKN